MSVAHKVIIIGSSAVAPFVGGVAVSLAKLNPPINIIYGNSGGSCVGDKTMDVSPSTYTKAVMQYTGTPEMPMVDPNGCTLGAGEELTADIGASDVFAKTCIDPVVTLASDVKDFQGPWQAMDFVVPAGSNQSSISAEAAYLTYGITGGDPGLPYDTAFVFQRSDTSGTQLTLSANIGLAANLWVGTNIDPTTMMAYSNTAGLIKAMTTDLPSGTDPKKAIGIAASGDVDGIRNQVKVLAFQPRGGSCGYTPDSDSSTAFDKANVRDGHYTPAGPVHFYAHATNGKSTNADVQKVLDALTGVGDPGFDLIHVEEKAGVVPDCAMRVSRTEDGGALASYMPAQSCECKWLSEAGVTLPDSCVSCNSDSDCHSAAPKCHFGYCEVK
jgi:hypothetical protein